MNKRAALWMAAAWAVPGLALAGCGGTSGGGYGAPASSPSSSAPASTSAPASASSSAPASAQAAAGVTLKTSSVGGQTIVVDGKAMTVYVYTRDNKGTTASACVGGCATLWPAVTTTGSPTLQGVTGAIGSIKTADGKDQVTINGMPIYYYAKDTAAGDIKGQGVAGVWYVVGANGNMIQASLTAGGGTSGY